MGAPSIYVYDCSNAGIIVESFKQFAEQHEKEFEVHFLCLERGERGFLFLQIEGVHRSRDPEEEGGRRFRMISWGELRGCGVQQNPYGPSRVGEGGSLKTNHVVYGCSYI